MKFLEEGGVWLSRTD